MSTPDERLLSAIARRKREPISAGDFTDAPGPYEYATRELVERVDSDLRELRGEVRRFWWTLVGAIAVSIILQLVA